MKSNLVNNYLNFLILIILIFSCSENNKSKRDNYLNEVFDIIEEHSIMKDSIDFIRLRKNAFSKIENTKSIEDCYPIVTFVIKELNDNHSFFIPEKKYKSLNQKNSEAELTKIITFTGEIINNNIGYISMEGYSNSDSTAIQTYTDSLHKLIKQIDKQGVKGWVIDIRKNTGGNCWPMMTGLGSLIGEGINGYFIDSEKNKSSWFYKNGTSGIDSRILNSLSTIKPYKIIDSTAPIAVLTGEKTASSGEIIATAFLHKSNTKFFGKPTAGLTTGNQMFILSDSSVIVLTTAIYMDRNDNLLGGKIWPDVFCETSKPKNSVLQSTNIDITIEKVISWINEN